MGQESNRSQRKTRQGSREKRSLRVEVRMSKGELEALDAFCRREGMTRSDAMRLAVGSCPPRVVITRNVDLERVASELRSIGANLNQMARKVNGSHDLAALDRFLLEKRIKEVGASVEKGVSEVERLRAALGCGREAGDGDD